MRTVAVVGSGLAGTTVCMSLREQGFDGDILLLGDEPVVAYSKPPLSKSYLLAAHPVVTQAYTSRDLADAGVRVELGAEVVGLDVAGRYLRTARGGRIEFDEVVIATGVQARRLAALQRFDNVLTLRTLADADRLHARLGRVERICIVGGGFIGAELAAAARELGKQVILVEAAPQLMSASFGPQIGAAVGRMHTSRGVDLRLGVRIASVHGKDAIEQVRLSDGSVIDADLVVLSIGVEPATGWLEGSGLDITDGVLADASCRAAPHVWVAGDVARWHNRRFDRTMRVEHWSNAGEQGSAVGRNMCVSHPEPYSPLPYFWSDQYDASIQFLGVGGAESRVELVSGDASDEQIVALFSTPDGSRLTGVLALRSRRALLRLRALFDRRLRLDEALRDARHILADAGHRV